MARLVASVLSLAALVGLAACSNTWDGFKRDVDKTGKQIEQEAEDI